MGMPATDMFGKPWPTNPHQDNLQKSLGGPMHDGRTERRDQWSGKGTIMGGNFGRVEGFDAANFADPKMQTAKYQGGRIFSKYDPNDPGVLNSILADEEFRGSFPGAKGVGPDKIDFGDGRPVDVIRGHGAPGAAFSWQTMDVPTPTSNTMPVSNAPASLGQSDLMAQVLAALQAQQEPDPQMLLQQAMR